MAKPKAHKGDVAYIAPEALAAEARAKAVEKNRDADPEVLIEAIEKATRNASGEYRIVEDYEEVGGKNGAPARQRPRYGDRVVWVDDAPGDDSDGSGHYEVYDQTEHGKPYRPIFNQSAEESKEVVK